MTRKNKFAPKLINLKTALSRKGTLGMLFRPLAPFLEAVLSIKLLNSIYSEVHAGLTDFENDPAFFMKTLKVMGIHFEVNASAYEHIPQEGPLLVISNHPFGGIDGVILGAMLQSVRPDAKLMGNYLLSKMKGIRGSIINVDPFERVDSARSNLKGMREALCYLKSGGCIGIFPAGEVSRFHWKDRSVVDRSWNSHVVNLARRTGAKILPVFFEGRNSVLFQSAGLIHPGLRTALLPREFTRMRNKEFHVQVGKAIDSKQLERFESKEATTEYLRLESYFLRARGLQRERKRHLRLPFRVGSNGKLFKPLAVPLSKSRIVGEIQDLPSSCLLVAHGDFSIYYATADKIPNVMLEIGRLREETFRAVQEGTGQDRDLDDFDNYYLHLFMWDTKEEEIVGAYRIGKMDEILSEYGKHGLYTATLFNYKLGFLEKLGPALELGRSFICLKYQKKYASLALIWRGIGEFVLRYPKYKILFGPVSITDAYHNISKNLMVHFFREHTFDEEMSQLVRAKKPPKIPKVLRGISMKSIGETITSVDSVSAIISRFEDDEKGIPILLRHYLKLNGVFLSFNVDPAFCNAIDGLILVDLTKTEAKFMKRYLGKQGYVDFMNHHSEETVLV